MIYGFPYGVAYGTHEAPEMFTQAQCEVLNGTDYNLSWTVNDECDGFYVVAIDGAKVNKPIFCIGGIKQQAIINVPAGSRLISICPQGPWSDTHVRIQDQIDALYEDGIHFPIRLQVNIAALPKQIISGTAQLDNLVLYGMRRGNNVEAVPGRRQWGTLGITIVLSGGVYTVTGYLGNRAMLTGSRATATGEVTLSGAGMVGTVDLDYTADVAIEDDAQLIFKWPQLYRIHLKATPFIGADFPRTADAEIVDDGQRNMFVFKSFKRDGGNNYVVVHQIGDDGNESTDEQGGGKLFTTYDVPDPVTDLAYVSGDADATVISYTVPSVGADSVNIYDSEDTGELNLTTSVLATGTGAQTATLADIGSYTGFRYIVVRASNAGVEEPNGTVLVLEYDAGSYIPVRPPPPKAGLHWETDGLTLSVPVSIYLDPRKSTPTTVELFIYLKGDTVDYDTPTSSTNVPENVGETAAITMTVTGDVGSDGVYLFELRTKHIGEEPLLNEVGDPVLNESGDPVLVTTGNDVQSDNVDIYGPVELTEEVMEAPLFDVVNA